MAISPINLKFIFFGTGEFGLPCFKTLIECGAKPLLVITSPDKPSGRGLRLTHSPIKEIALHANIPVLQPENINDPQIVDKLRQLQADLGVLIAYGQKIGPVLINIFRHGIINLHASLLPSYRGAAPVNWAIINGETQTGLTIMQIGEQIDSGKILTQQVVPIDPQERADELHNKLAQFGPQLMVETIFQLQQGILQPKPQDTSLVSKAPKLSKSLSVIDWNLPAQKIANLIRGLWSWPTATSVYQSSTGKHIPVAFARAVPLETSRDREGAGIILDDFSVTTGSGRLKILEIKPAGSKLMTWQDFINGRHVKPADRFVSLEPQADEQTKANQ
ncbi:MAG: methionyl-tRNA formyltransferase [Phycisphaerae bacterium]